MLNVCCIQSGNYLGRGAEYVNILFDSVRRNLPEGYEGRFICFTDDPTGLDVGIEPKPLPAPFPGWWSKVALFRDGLFAEGERVIFLDLDTLITGRLDDIFSYDGDFAILTDFLRPHGWQSSVMSWRAGAPKLKDVWPAYAKAGFPINSPDGDQGWIESHVATADSWQDLFPGQFVSFKQINGIPEKATVVVFHGNPRPHEVTTGWVPEVWKKGGMSRAELKAVCNEEHEKVMSNVRNACIRKLPWFDFDGTTNDRHAVIVGGGPSLVDTIDDIKKRKAYGQEIWALNNSAAFLIENGIIPDAHFIVDARPENAAFVRDSHAKTTYYIASQCHPAVFVAVAHRNVVLWHAQTEGMVELLNGVTDQPVHLIGGGSTVALHALSMAYLMGYKKIHCYGLDSSYRETHHAYPQALNDSDIVLDVLYGDQKFKCSSWMTGQAEEFMAWYRYMSDLDVTITVHGDGLLPAMHHDEMMNGHVTCAKVRAWEVLSRLSGQFMVGVEVGVFAGEMSRALLQRDDLFLYMVDAWEGDGASYTEGAVDWNATLSQESQDAYMEDAGRRTNFAADRRRIIKARSAAAAETFDDGTLDFVFIDADHTYTGCKTDIDAWLPKLKNGGLLCGHDYKNTEIPFDGVDQAVDEFAKQTGLELELGENFTWFIRVDNSVIAERYAA